MAVAALLFAPATALAGPPFQTDDPEPIDYRHFEFYTFANSDGTSIETDTEGPALEFNWGALPNVHLHVIVPVASALPAIGARTYGSVRSILDNNLDRHAAPQRAADGVTILHHNIRGPRYYH